MLYAQNRWSLLLVFQAMDAAGKDSTIKHVMSGVNPQGCQVVSFKQPTSEDLDHDFMWRYMRRLPERGRIGIFNRSYYEEVLVVRVHEEILKRQQLPPELVGRKIWDERFADITHFEDYLTRQGTIVLKFFLNLSREEQKRRFLQRLERPEKNWKFSASDVHERKFWDDYMHAFEEAIRATASETDAVVRGASRQQVVHPARCRSGDRRGSRGAQSHISKGRRGEEQGVGGCACGACRPDLMRRVRRPSRLGATALRPLLEARALCRAICGGKELAPSFRAAAEFANAPLAAPLLRTTTEVSMSP